MTSGLENSGSRWSREVGSGRGVGFRKKQKQQTSVCALYGVHGPFWQFQVRVWDTKQIKGEIWLVTPVWRYE